MTYEFDFDLTDISRSFFRELAKFSESKGIHSGASRLVEEAVNRFDIQEITGVPVSDVESLVSDMIDIHVHNLATEEEFKNSNNRALFLPHCARKYMDNRCEARFDSDRSTYVCEHCSSDCLVSQATQLGEKNGYDIYVLPGGSCIPGILKTHGYDAIVGVACSDEIKLAKEYLEEKDITYQGIPLLKNGCSSTEFNMKTFKQVLGRAEE